MSPFLECVCTQVVAVAENDGRNPGEPESIWRREKTRFTSSVQPWVGVGWGGGVLFTIDGPGKWNRINEKPTALKEGRHSEHEGARHANQLAIPEGAGNLLGCC